MEPQQVRAFAAVARTGSFSRAAEQLFRTQPSVTMAVQALERELKATLFERLGRRVRLTPSGERFLELAGPLVGQWDRLREEFSAGEGPTLRGTVRMGSGEAVLLYVLPKLVAAFRKKYPAVEFQLSAEPQEETLRRLFHGEIDFGLRSLRQVPAWGEYRPFRTCERLAIVAKGHPLAKTKRLTLEALAAWPFILPGKRSASRAIVERALAQAGLPLKVAVEAGGWETIKRYAAEGLGVAIVPDLCPGKSDPIARLPVSHLFGRDIYGIVTKAGRPLPVAAMRFKEFLERR